MDQRIFKDRTDAGRVLAGELAHLAGRSDLVVLALPRGGVPVAFEVAQALRAPLDVFIVRKLGVPGHQEYAMGALASGGERVLDEAIVHRLGLSAAAVEAVVHAERLELERREELYRGGRPLPDLRGRSVVVVDDGLATGSTMLAAVRALRRHRPAHLVVAVPTAAVDGRELLRGEADEVVCASTPDPFRAVGCWYEHFEQTGDDEVRRLLALARSSR